MNPIIKKTLIFISILGFIESHMAYAKKSNDLICILDPHLQEDVTGRSFADTSTFIDALYEQVSPIVVSINIVRNFCYWKHLYKKSFEDMKKDILQSKSVDQNLKRFFPQDVFINSKTNDTLLLLSGVNLSDKDWHCYIHKQCDLVLLIPKKYIATKSSHVKSGTVDDQIKACGLQVSEWNKVNASSDSILQYIKSTADNKSVPMINIVDGINSIFIKKDPSVEREDFGWNIYIIGHGGPGSPKSDIKLRYEMRKMMAMELKKSATTEGQLEMLKFITEDVDRAAEALKKAESLSDEAIVPQTATIAGLSFDEFSNLMRVFNTSIKTNFLYYTTCFGGGVNQTFVNNELQKLDVNFIVVAEGFSDASTFKAHSIPIIILDKSTMQPVLSNMRFTHYFRLLEKFFYDSTIAVAEKAFQNWQKDPIATIVSTMIPLSVASKNQPFVRIPRIGIFTALRIDKEVKFLTHAIVKSYELEKRTIDCANQDVRRIFIYPNHIQVPLKISDQIIISPTPQKVEHLDNKIHILEEVISTTSLDVTILNFIQLNQSIIPITFVIKQLKTPSVVAENIIIKIQSRNFLGMNKIDFHITIMYMIKGRVYQKNLIDFNLDQNVESIAQDYNKYQARVVEPEYISTYVRFLLSAEDDQSFQGKSIGLADVVKFFDSKLNKEFEVQKPGALKKVLLLQQLSGLEEAITPEAILAQKEWLKKTNKPITVFVDSLNRYKSDLIQLEANLQDAFNSKLLDQNEYAQIKDKIKAVNASLSKLLVESTSAKDMIGKKAVVVPVQQDTQVGQISEKEIAELRQAVIDYKKNRGRAQATQIINKYASKYPNDSFVKSKINEKDRFDKESVTQPTQKSVQVTQISEKEIAELRQAVIDYKKNKERAQAVQIINKYANKYPNDSFVRSKINEKDRFDKESVTQPAQDKKQVVKKDQSKKSVAKKDQNKKQATKKKK